MNRDLTRAYFNPHSSTSFTAARQLIAKFKGIYEPEEIKKWLHKKKAYTMFFPRNKKFKTNKMFVPRKNHWFFADLADMSKLSRWNRGTKFLMCVIDGFSRMGYVVPIKSKQPSEIIRATKLIFKRAKSPGLYWYTDAGGEFTAKVYKDFMKEQGVNLIFARSEKKSFMAENFILHLK